MATGIIVAAVIVFGIIAFIAFFAVSVYNRLIRGRSVVEEAFANMDVYLKKRTDLIPNLVETVKAYAKHESAALENVIRARSSISSAGSDQERFVNENTLSGTLKSLFAVAESYPQLKADSQFMNLQMQLQSVEHEIASARKGYNDCVKHYNISVESFPNVLLSGILGFPRRVMFEITDPAEREAVKVSF